MLQATTIDPETVRQDWIEVAGHPDFGAAARLFATNILEVACEDRTLAAVFKDAGHYVTAMSAAYLDTRGGLNLTLLRQICAATGLLTANRAAALIDFMLHIGVLEPAPDARYRTTPAFQKSWCRHIQAALAPAVLLDPALASVPAALDDEAVYQNFLGIQASRLYALAGEPDPFPALRASFLHPLAGCSILHRLTLACTDDHFTPIEGATVPLAELSRQFGVSQPHVRRLLKRAEANRFLLHVGPSRRAFDPAGFSIIRYHYAAHLAELLACGRLILAHQTPAASEDHALALA